jgi:hypothetical protein
MREKVPRDTSMGGQQVFAPVHGQAAARNGLSNQPDGNEKTHVSWILAKLGLPAQQGSGGRPGPGNGTGQLDLSPGG